MIPKTTLTEAVVELPAREPFIGDHEMFHVEKMGEFGGHLVRLGRVLERLPKSPAMIAHAHSLAEDLARLLHLSLVESRQDAAGVVLKS